MQPKRRLLAISLGIVVALAILTVGAFVPNKWLPQPANFPPSTESPQATSQTISWITCPTQGWCNSSRRFTRRVII